jgi:hypothetical protein
MANWIEKIKTQFSITMGDGKVYTPFSFNANKSDEFNLAAFNFRNLDGTLIDRRRRMGTVYNLELYFNGGDHLEQAQKFQKSSWNTKPWTIQHNMYGQLTVQPISPVFYDNNNKLLNATCIKVTVQETIGAAQVAPTESEPDVIATTAASNAQHFADYYVATVPIPSVSDTNQMKANISGFQKALSKISNGADALRNAYNSAFSSINNAIHDVSAAVSQIQYYLSLPAYIEDSVINRVNYIAQEIDSLQAQVENLHLVPLKALWLNNAGSCLNAMCVATITNIATTDYVYSSQVLTVISSITTRYNAFVDNLDTLQTFNGSEPDSWIADPQCIQTLDDLVSYTLATLFAIQANALQPRTVTLTKDNNIINVAWSIYGLLPDDSTIDRIIADNNLSGDELWQLPKGKQILYYA